MKNTTTYATSVLFRVWDTQVCSLTDVDDLHEMQYSLVGINQIRVATGALVGWTADKCICCGAVSACDDIVMHPRGIAVAILACILSDDGSLYLNVELMERSVGRSAWAQTQKQCFVLARDAQQVAAWRQRADGCIIVIE